MNYIIRENLKAFKLSLNLSKARLLFSALLITFSPITLSAQQATRSGDGVDIFKNSREIHFNFRNTQDTWTYGFADFPVGGEDFYELVGERRELPDYLEPGTSAMFISGNNHSDDLFMYVRTRLTGLRPNFVYRINFALEIATNAASGCNGVGGAPGEGVTLKVGASTREPLALTDNQNFYRMNIDKGNQSQEGKNALNIGDIANTSSDCDGSARYELKQLISSKAVEARTDSRGKLWIFLGTDSGFEATTAIYYTDLRLELQKVRKSARLRLRKLRK